MHVSCSSLLTHLLRQRQRKSDPHPLAAVFDFASKGLFVMSKIDYEHFNRILAELSNSDEGG
jgi:hypothetical protein